MKTTKILLAGSTAIGLALSGTAFAQATIGGTPIAVFDGADGDQANTGGALDTDGGGIVTGGGGIDTGTGSIQTGGGAIDTAGGAITSTGVITGGTVNSTGDVNATGNVTGVDGTFTGNVSGVDGTFTGAVSGDSVAATNDVTAGGNVVATGNVSGVDGTFTGAVSGDSVAATNDVTAGGNVVATGNVSGVDGTFTGVVQGDTVVADNGLTVSAGGANIAGGASITGGNLNMNGNDIDNVGTLNVNDIAAVNGTFTGTLQVDGLSSLNGGVDTNGADINTDTGNINTGGGNISAGTGTVSGLNGNFTTVSATDVNATNVNAAGGTVTAGTLQVNGVGTVSGLLNANGGIDTNGAGIVTDNGAINAGTGAITGGIGTFSGVVNANGGIDTNGAGIVTDNGAINAGSGAITTTGTVSAGTVAATTGNITTVNATTVNAPTVNGNGTLTLDAGPGAGSFIQLTNGANGGALIHGGSSSTSVLVNNSGVTVTDSTNGQTFAVDSSGNAALLGSLTAAGVTSSGNVVVGDGVAGVGNGTVPVTINATTQRISGLANGTLSATSTEAVTGQQLFATNQAILGFQNGLDAVNGRVDLLTRRVDKAYQGVAMGFASNAAPLNLANGEGGISAGVGYFQGEWGGAVKAQYVTDSGVGLGLNVGFSSDAVGGGVGASIKF